MRQEYIQVGTKRLRRGYTTGSCAAAAAFGAASLLRWGRLPSHARLTLPGGEELALPLSGGEQQDGWAQAQVQKDSGDDPDITNGIWVQARVRPGQSGQGVEIRGGEGVGRVTLPGLACPVGEAAINPGPRAQIIQAVCAAYDGLEPDLVVEISIPGGKELAARTYNPRLGIVDGLSVLGTSGIVEPMSEEALVESIRLELRQLRALGEETVVLTPGNYGQDFIQSCRKIPDRLAVKCSNFIGAALDEVAVLGFEQVLLIGHVGKLCKLAAGVMNTHSRWADARAEVFVAYAALEGASRPVLEELFSAVTTDAMLDILCREGLAQAVMERVLNRVEQAVSARLGGTIPCGVLIFSQEHGELCRSCSFDRMLQAVPKVHQTKGE